MRKDQIVDSFNFGIPGEDIVFSRPVAIEITTDIPNGSLVDVQVRHGNDIDFSRRGLTLDPDAMCDPEGNASKKLGSIYVISGKVLFYTCGASTFIINAGGTTGLKSWFKGDTLT